MKKLRRGRWTAAVALSTLLAAQGGAPLVYAQGANSDARFRSRVGIQPGQPGFIISKPASEASSTPVAPSADDRSSITATPIKHVILIIGENRTFDHVFATY